MYETIQRHGEFSSAGTVSFGRIGRRYPLTATARRAFRFGDAAARSGPTPAIRALLQAIEEAARRVLDQWRRRQQASATYAALRALDARTLRDIGLDRSELASVATEFAGAADPTRVRVLPRVR